MKFGFSVLMKSHAAFSANVSGNAVSATGLRLIDAGELTGCSIAVGWVLGCLLLGDGIPVFFRVGVFGPSSLACIEDLLLTGKC